MTIDEAIEKEKFKARVDRIKANKRIFHNNDEDEISSCNRSAEEHEQIAEWLKLLKELLKINVPRERTIAFHDGYSKAIDDFVRFANTMPTVESEDGTIRPMWLEEIAEQLKEQK